MRPQAAICKSSICCVLIAIKDRILRLKSQDMYFFAEGENKANKFALLGAIANFVRNFNCIFSKMQFFSKN